MNILKEFNRSSFERIMLIHVCRCSRLVHTVLITMDHVEEFSFSPELCTKLHLHIKERKFGGFDKMVYGVLSVLYSSISLRRTGNKVAAPAI